MASLSANRRGILAMIGSMAFFSVNDMLMKLASAALPVSQTVAIRNAIALAALAVVVVGLRQTRQLRRAGAPLVVLRGVLEALTAFCFLTALSKMPIADVTAIAIGSPLFIALLAGPLLGERIGWQRWAAALIGFAGVLLVVKPGSAAFTTYTLLALATPLFVAGRDMLTRKIDPTIASETVTFTTTLVVTVLAAGLGAAEALAGDSWLVPGGMTFAWLVLAGLFVIVGNYLVVVAFRGAEVSVVSPFRYTVLLWAILFGIVVFGTVPDALALAGAGLIVGAGIYTLHQENVRARRAAA